LGAAIDQKGRLPPPPLRPCRRPPPPRESVFGCASLTLMACPLGDGRGEYRVWEYGEGRDEVGSDVASASPAGGAWATRRTRTARAGDRRATGRAEGAHEHCATA